MDAITLSRSFLSRRARLPIDGAYAVTRLIRCERIPETGFLSGLASNAKVRIANLLFPHCQTISPSSDHVLGIIERQKLSAQRVWYERFKRVKKGRYPYMEEYTTRGYASKVVHTSTHFLSSWVNELQHRTHTYLNDKFQVRSRP